MAGSAFQLADLVADSLAAAGLGVWGCILAVAFEGRTIRIADAHRGDGKRFIVRADDKLSAFVELERQALTAGVISHPFMLIRPGAQ